MNIKKQLFSRIFRMALLFLLPAGSWQATAQQPSRQTRPIDLDPFSDSARHWYGIHDNGNVINPLPGHPAYREDEVTKIADNILLLQRDNGGWPKNYDVQAILSKAQADSLRAAKKSAHTTFDNSTTYSHINYLANVYAQTGQEKYKEAALKGLRFTLSAQYPNGGWPQFFPLENNYSRRITFNDGAFTGVMVLLKKISDGDPAFAFVDQKMRSEVKAAFAKGLDCILKCQIREKGRLTAWCQQHDETTLQPAWARAYEPPSISNGESVQIVLMLMSIDHPDQRVIEAVEGAIRWFNESRIYHTRVKTVQASAEQSQWKTSTTDRIVVTDTLAPPIWTRFYELGTARPLFSDRNSKMLYSLAEVSRERRSGYSWYTYEPQKALVKYPQWRLKVGKGEADGLVMAVKMGDSERLQFPDPWTVDYNPRPVWNYTQGLIAYAQLQLWKENHQEAAWLYAKKYADKFIDASGVITGYKQEEFSLDMLNSGKFLFDLYQATKDERYLKAIKQLRKQFRSQPRTAEGGFWHKLRYPNQMWLDGLYMGAPFYAQYALAFNEPAAFDDVVNQFVVVHKHTFDPKTGLNYHGWDESKSQKWANPATGCSPCFWGRAMGWYAMALVDVLDFLPGDHAGRVKILDMLNQVAAGIKKYQDPATGLWFQVLDQGNREGNYTEATASSMFVYALLKAVRMGYLPDNYREVAVKGYNGLLSKLVKENEDGAIRLTRCCSVAGLGGNPYRDGSYDYYVHEPVRDNDPKGVGPFILASLEYDKLYK